METRHTDTLSEIVDSALIKLPQLMLLLMANKQLAGWHVADITKATGAQPSAVTMAKQKLASQGLLVEHFPERDKRVTKVYLTEKGHETASDMWRTLRALVAAEDAIRAAGTLS
jgi:DNA-binding MarR family transcriptional regulator